MAFALIRARNLKVSDLGSTDRHNARKYNDLEDYPPNIDPSKKDVNIYHWQDGSSLNKSWKARTEGVTGLRKDSNVAIEYVLGINDQRAWQNYDANRYFMSARQWIEDRHGIGSVISTSIHHDESNPHVHFVVVPIVTKEVKWKNRRGEGTKIEKRIDTRSYTGGRLKLRKLQDDYYAFAKTFEFKMGVKLFRGKLVEEQTREYIKKTDHQIGEMRAELASMSEGIEKMKLSLQIEEKRKEKEEQELKLKELERQKHHGGDKWKEKGVKDNPVMFHSEKEHKKAMEKIVKPKRKGMGR